MLSNVFDIPTENPILPLLVVGDDHADEEVCESLTVKLEALRAMGYETILLEGFEPGESIEEMIRSAQLDIDNSKPTIEFLKKKLGDSYAEETEDRLKLPEMLRKHMPALPDAAIAVIENIVKREDQVRAYLQFLLKAKALGFKVQGIDVSTETRKTIQQEMRDLIARLSRATVQPKGNLSKINALDMSRDDFMTKNILNVHCSGVASICIIGAGHLVDIKKAMKARDIPNQLVCYLPVGRKVSKSDFLMHTLGMALEGEFTVADYSFLNKKIQSKSHNSDNSTLFSKIEFATIIPTPPRLLGDASSWVLQGTPCAALSSAVGLSFLGFMNDYSGYVTAAYVQEESADRGQLNAAARTLSDNNILFQFRRHAGKITLCVGRVNDSDENMGALKKIEKMRGK